MAQDNEFRERIVDFLRYYEEHKRFYELASQKAVVLEVYTRDLKKLAVRWAEAKIGAVENGGQQEESEEDSASFSDQSNGCQFVEDRELAELAGLTRGLKGLSGDFAGMRPWLNDAEEINRRVSGLSASDPTLLISCTIILSTEQEALQNFLLTTSLLTKGVGLLESRDFLPADVHDDLSGPRFIPRLLLVASGMVNNGANAARAGADLIHSNENRWKNFIKTTQLKPQSEETKPASNSPTAISHPELGQISKNIAAWTEENFAKAKALFPSDAKVKGFRFVRVIEIPKVWQKNGVWLVDALIEYDIAGAKRKNITFQVDVEGKIIGFNLFEPVKAP